jgi:hypothetical protein
MNVINILLIILLLYFAQSLRLFRTWSNRTLCEKSRSTNFPFAYSKHSDQKIESKGRVNTNLQDFRHDCQIRGGRSKCHICEDIECLSDTSTCHLQLQGYTFLLYIMSLCFIHIAIFLEWFTVLLLSITIILTRLWLRCQFNSHVA